ncbi:MAG: signal peptide peptidase SppA [Phycisphaerae bacterium]|nr:signal peptide peptidase SppA [Phycisphaerae bacterium]
MEFENNNENQQPQTTVSGSTQKNKKSSFWKILWGLFTGLSVFANFIFLLVIIAIIAFLATGHISDYEETTIEPGPQNRKIAIINLNGMIDNQQSDDITQQLKMLKKDKSLKALILKINSPGGTVSASDQINNQIKKFKLQTNIPVIAFMQSLAASGGYYSAVATDKIVAEPTAITGSIGVIMGYFVLQELLENKLGIMPVIIKSGEKKDWPSAFSPPTPEQKQYLTDRIITPAFQRFLDVIKQGRPSLDPQKLATLADGSIFPAPLALEEGLIDQIGYLDDCIETAKQMAKIKDAKVVEYKKTPSFYDMLTSQQSSSLKLDRKTLHQLSTPQLMYLWNCR